MHTAKSRARRPEAYRAYVEDRAMPEDDKGRRKKLPAHLGEALQRAKDIFPSALDARLA